MRPPDGSMEAYVLRVLREQLLRPDLRPSSRLLDDGILDSLAFVDLIVRIESDLDLRLGIEETDLQLFATPSSIAEHLEQMRSSRGEGIRDGEAAPGPDGRGDRAAAQTEEGEAEAGSETTENARAGPHGPGGDASRLVDDGAVLRG